MSISENPDQPGKGPRLVPGTGGDVLVLSMRRTHDLVAYCTPYEFEDVVTQITGADLVEVDDFASVEKSRRAYKLARAASGSRQFARRVAPSPPAVRLTREYELFLPVFSGPHQLYALAAVPEWRKRCRRAACLITEVWSDQLPEYLIEMLADFDHVFLSSQHPVADVARITGRPVTYLPYAADVVRFAPLPGAPIRAIDVCNIGRRSDVTHRALLELADQRRIFYFYDTVAGGTDLKQRTFRVDVASEHRRLLASLLQRSRYFIANRSRVNEPEFLAGRDEISARFYEGAAAGAVMIGEAPRNDEFKRQFDWPDAVVHMPFHSPDIGELLARLDADPERLVRTRRDSVHNAATRHDWMHRYETIATTLGIGSTPAMRQRRDVLDDIALRARTAPL